MNRLNSVQMNQNIESIHDSMNRNIKIRIKPQFIESNDEKQDESTQYWIDSYLSGA